MASSTSVSADGSSSKHEPYNSDPESAARVASAVQFLLDPRVRQSPVSSKVNFLRSKGLSLEEISEAFSKSGQPHSRKELKDALNRQQRVAGATTGTLPFSTGYDGNNHLAGFRSSTVHHSTGPLYPAQPPLLPSEGRTSQGANWKDYVIAAGAAVLSGFAAFKAFQAYSPYELRLREEGIKTKQHRSKRRVRHSSESDVDPREVRHRLGLTPVPETPTVVSAQGNNRQEEVERLQSQLNETQEALERETKSKAELSVSLGKLRGQAAAYQRTIDKQEAQIKALQEELEKLKRDIEDKGKPEGAHDSNVAVSSPGPQHCGDVSEAVVGRNVAFPSAAGTDIQAHELNSAGGEPVPDTTRNGSEN
ncbi:Peroxisomal membrane anchor protein (Pex14p) conserved region [Trypanosoma vivax]|nr:Peroxisomal membrane anchor protein (Pex14p) conserved region [Trypanosoma vivax]